MCYLVARTWLCTLLASARRARCTRERELSRHLDHQKIPTGRVLRAPHGRRRSAVRIRAPRPVIVGRAFVSIPPHTRFPLTISRPKSSKHYSFSAESVMVAAQERVETAFGSVS